MHPRKPTRKMSMFFQRIHRQLPREYQFVAVSTRAGAIIAKVDILTAPSNDTTKSSQGTVAARATREEEKRCEAGF